MAGEPDFGERVRRYYDVLGEGEWERLERNVRGRVSLEIHRRFLRRFVAPGSRVLEVGAGPGRFTLELAAIGALDGGTHILFAAAADTSRAG